MISAYSSELESILERLKTVKRIVILTGAGMSAESGIPTFRGKGGLWEKYDPEKYATAEALRLRPKEVWEMHNELRQTIANCKPNPGHYAIVDLEKIFKHVTVITQNVDNYHQDAGSSSVLELHGNAWRVKCTAENTSWVDRTVPYKKLPPVCKCGAILRPDVVFFNEPLDSVVLETAFSEVIKAQVVLVVGTSYIVYPAASLPYLAKESGSILIEINLEPTLFSTMAEVSLFGKSGEILPELLSWLEKKI